MRKLASVQQVAEIKPIEGADSIEAVRVNGWWVVAKKGEYSVNDPVIYLEVDSWVPSSIAPFLTKDGKEAKEFNGVKGERLRTVRLRGQLSQGLLLPCLSTLTSVHSNVEPSGWVIGTDVTEILGIQKWEAPVPAQLAGQVRGNFPSLIPKTDQDRIQNLVQELEQWKISKMSMQVTEKLHGSSCTFYLDTDGDFHVCSRNMDLKYDENNAFWKAALKYDVEKKMRDDHLYGFAIQGELIGNGINGNQYKTDLDFYVFDVYSVQGGHYVYPKYALEICEMLELKHVPVINPAFILDNEVSVDTLLAMAEGKSVLNGSEREGLVFKSNENRGLSFKAVSNKWLIKTGE